MNRLESFDDPKFSTLEKEQMGKLLGGVKDETRSSIVTDWCDGRVTLDVATSDDTPPPPIWC